MYYVYILRNNSKDFHYVGLTINLERRFKEHQDGFCIPTKGYLPLALVWYAVFKDKSKAAFFEKYLKSGSGRAFSKKHLL